MLGDVKLRSRVALVVDGPSSAPSNAGLLVTRPQTDVDPSWKDFVARAHAMETRVAFTLATTAQKPGEGSPAENVRRAAELGFDLLVLDPGHDDLAIEHLPFVVETARAVWPSSKWIAAVVHDIPRTRGAVVGHAAQLRRVGANLLWIDSPGDGSARLPAAPIADRLRNELHVPTCVDADDATLADLDAAIAAGRADLFVATRMPSTHR
jgi:hypothetical protein